MNPQELDEHIRKLKNYENDILQNNIKALNSFRSKSIIPHQKSWYEIKRTNFFIMNIKNKELSNYEFLLNK